MENLGGHNLFTSHFVIGSRKTERKYTKTETDEIRALHDWLNYKDTDWGMKRYRTSRTQYVSFLHIIDINTLKQILNWLVTTYKKQFPYSTKNDFINQVFSYSLFELKKFIERDYTWFSEAPGEADFSFYTYFCDSFKEFLDFAIPSDFTIEHYKQYYRKVIELIENLDYESAPQPLIEREYTWPSKAPGVANFNQNIKPILSTKNQIVIKPDAVLPLFNILKDFFPKEQQDELKRLLEEGNDTPQPLYFVDKGNRLADAFKRTKEADLITGCNKKELQTWLCRNFIYRNNKSEQAAFTPDYAKRCLTQKYPACKNPLPFEIRNGQIVKTN